MATFNALGPACVGRRRREQVSRGASAFPTDAADVRGEGVARIRRMSANGRPVASEQKPRRAGKLAQASRASMAYVTRSRSKLRRQFTAANAKLDG